MKFALPAAALLLCSSFPAAASAQTDWGAAANGPQPRPPYAGKYPSSGQPQPSLQSGGLAPPPPINEDAQSAQTEQRLDDADKKDSGRGLQWVYLNGEIGMQHLGLQTFHAGGIVDARVVPTTQTGLLYGAGVGVRLLFLTLGARFRIGTFSHYDLWTLGGEVGLRVPIGLLEPYFVLGGGFASLGSFSANDLGGASSKDVSVTGYDVRVGGGLDIYVTPTFSIGGNVTADVVGLSRPGVTISSAQKAAATGTAPYVYQADGSSVGGSLTVTAVLGLHF